MVAPSIKVSDTGEDSGLVVGNQEFCQGDVEFEVSGNLRWAVECRNPEFQ